MRTDTMQASSRGLGLSSMGLGFLGLVFSWWVPLGIVLSMAGLTLGFVGWVFATRRSHTVGWMIGGVVLSAVALALDLYVAGRGLETVRLLAF